MLLYAGCKRIFSLSLCVPYENSLPFRMKVNESLKLKKKYSRRKQEVFFFIYRDIQERALKMRIRKKIFQLITK